MIETSETFVQQERDELQPREKIRGFGLRQIFVRSHFLQKRSKKCALSKTSHTLLTLDGMDKQFEK